MLTEDEIAARYKTAVEVARKAGQNALFSFRAGTAVETKAGDEVVTDVDRTIELFIRSELHGCWPGDGLFGEEFRGSLCANAAWIIDPIDGTSNYASGIAHWCVSIALVCNGEPALGVVFDPCHDELFGAIAGKGAWLNGKRLACRSATTLRGAVIGFGLTQKIEPSWTFAGLARLAALELPSALRAPVHSLFAISRQIASTASSKN